MRYVLIALLLTGCAGFQAYQPRPGDQVTQCDFAGGLGVICHQTTQPKPVGPSNVRGTFDQEVRH